MSTEKLGFIGVGNMGEALLRGIIGSEFMSPGDIMASDMNLEKLGNLSRELGIAAVDTNRELVKKSDIVLLALKPDVIKSVLSEISADLCKPKWCISIAAGVSIADIEGTLQTGSPVVRVMPNTPAMVYEGMIAMCPGTYTSEDHILKAQQIFQSVQLGPKTMKIPLSSVPKWPII